MKEVGALYDIPVPSVNVIGAPLTGKSSIIECLIGFDFLPKATVNNPISILNIKINFKNCKFFLRNFFFIKQNGQVKTVCPIEIKMVHLSKNKENDYITFDDEIDKKYFDFAEAKKKIEKLLESKNGEYSDAAIKLNLFSYYCADMKIIDLPGITNSCKLITFIA